MILSLVVAASQNHVIGKDNKLLWHLPNDLKYFKQLTLDHPVIMGRKTYESIGKPLFGRTNIVITKNKDWTLPSVIVTHEFSKAIAAANKIEQKETFIIGGGQIFDLALPLANKIYLTEVKAILEGDAFFKFDKTQWKETSRKDYEPDEKHTYGYSFVILERNS